MIIADRKGNGHEVPAASAPLADTHGHLAHFTGGNMPDVLCRAALAGVRLLAVPIDPVSDIGPKGPFGDVRGFLAWMDKGVEEAADRIVEALEQGVAPVEVGSSPFRLLDQVRILAGVHPYGAADLDDDALARLDALLASPRAVGVGEFGLDYGPYNELPPDVQEQAFRTQLRIAHARNLPVELHLRDPEQGDPQAHIDALRILQEEGVPAAGCDLHCYTSGPEVMAPFTDLGCYVAFGGAATFPKSDDIRAAAAACPSHLILTETDCPYMTPVPLRGSRCEPAMVAFTAAHLADVRAEAGIATRAETYAVLWDNARRFLGIA